MIETPGYGILESYDEFYEAIDMRLDIEFFLYGVRYYIGWDNKPYACVCPDGDAVYFDDPESLLKGYKINGKPIGDLWQDIQIYSM